MRSTDILLYIKLQEFRPRVIKKYQSRYILLEKSENGLFSLIERKFVKLGGLKERLFKVSRIKITICPLCIKSVTCIYNK